MSSETHQIPRCKYSYSEIEISDGFMLKSNDANKWFFTKSGEIVSMINATYYDGILHSYSQIIKTISIFLEKPFQSSFIRVSNYPNINYPDALTNVVGTIRDLSGYVVLYENEENCLNKLCFLIYFWNQINSTNMLNHQIL